MEYQKKRVKLITYIDHKSLIWGEMLPPKNLAFFKCGWEFWIFGGGIPPIAPTKYPCVQIGGGCAVAHVLSIADIIA